MEKCGSELSHCVDSRPKACRRDFDEHHPPRALTLNEPSNNLASIGDFLFAEARRKKQLEQSEGALRCRKLGTSAPKRLLLLSHRL